MFSLVVMAVISGCATTRTIILTPELVAERAKEFRSVSMKMLNEPGDVNRVNPDRHVTPLRAAIIFDPERVPELIAQGAKPHDGKLMQTPGIGSKDELRLALFRSEYVNYMWNSSPQSKPFTDPYIDLDLADFLLSNFNFSDCAMFKAYYEAMNGWHPDNTPEENELALRRMELLDVKHGGFELIGNKGSCRQSWAINYARKTLSRRGSDYDSWRPLYDETTRFWNMKKKRDKEGYSQEEWAQIYESMVNKDTQRKNKRKNDKKLALNKIHKNHNTYRSYKNIINRGNDCKSLQSVRNDILDFSCHDYISGSGSFTSESCILIKDKLGSIVSADKNNFCGLYSRQISQFSKNLDINPGIMKEIFEEAVRKSDINESLTQPYRNEIAEMRRIKEREKRGVKAGLDRDFHRSMNGLISHTERSFEAVNRQLSENNRRNNIISSGAFNHKEAASFKTDTRKLSGQKNDIDGSTGGKGPSGSSSTGKNKVCAGPFHRAEVVKVSKWIPKTPTLKCPSNTTPIAKGTANIDVPSKFLQGAWTHEPLGDGTKRYTLKSWDYECLCNSGKSIGTNSYQQ